MKNLTMYKLFAFVAMLSVMMTSCTVAKDIFKAGMWFGILGVVALVALLFWVIRSLGR